MVRVVVLDSSDAEFFSAHADVTLIKALPGHGRTSMNPAAAKS
jgi:enoyl-CoA hydratase/carnithine racemase